MIPLLAAGVLSPFFFEATPEVRSTYQSLGRIVEDRPMQMTSLRGGFDAGDFGRFGVRNWDVSSLTGRRSDAHRHALYHSELGLTWQRDIEIADGWRLRNDLTRSWTMYRGFGDGGSNRTYHWYQIDQSLENPYVVPFWRIRKCFRGSDYLYFKAGLRRRFEIRDGISVTPSVFAEGGSSRNQRRVLGEKPRGDWDDGVSSVSFRLEGAWRLSDCADLFAYVEQYEVVGGEERRAIGKSRYRCAHGDWTHFGIGIRFRL